MLPVKKPAASDAIRHFRAWIYLIHLHQLLRNSNITKSCGVSAYEVFQFLLLLVFQGRNLFRFLNSKHKDQAVSKNTYYRLLNETSYNWSRFLLFLAAKVTSRFDILTRPERVKVLVLDDSVVKRNRSKSVVIALPWRSYKSVPKKFSKTSLDQLFSILPFALNSIFGETCEIGKIKKLIF